MLRSLKGLNKKDLDKRFKLYKNKQCHTKLQYNMWIWIIVIACVIGGLIGFIGSDGENAGSDAAGGALAGGCMAAGCLMRIAFTALIILFILWLFGKLF